ncbi:MAG: SURF1 family protein [Gammaproteobacteria bacterium]|jgi:surfeit locus 1 family protein
MPSIAVALLLPLLLGLGFWQLDRATQKRAIEEDFAAGDRIAVSPTAAELERFARYRQVSLSGRFDGSRQFLLDNMTDGGAAGYHVLTPFRPEGWERSILVNRGWVRKDFSDPLPPAVDIDGQTREIRGRLARLPRPGIALSGDGSDGGSGDGDWPRVVQFPVMESLAEALGRPLAGRALLLDPEAPDGFLRRWQPAGLGPERHIAYAVQWFALAATLLVIYFVVNWKRKEHDGTDD